MFSPKKLVTRRSFTSSTTTNTKLKIDTSSSSSPRARSSSSPAAPPTPKLKNGGAPSTPKKQSVPPKVQPSPKIKSPYSCPSSPIASASPRSRKVKPTTEKKDDDKATTKPSTHTTRQQQLQQQQQLILQQQLRQQQQLLQQQQLQQQQLQQQQQQQQQQEDDDGEEGDDDFDPFVFIKNLPPLTLEMKNRKSPVPRKSLSAPRITLALDLDETLVHCSVHPIEKAELTFMVNFNGMDYEVYVRTRPHLHTFLEQVAQWFEVIVFTASQQVYADKLLDILDPEKKYIKYRVFRDSCVLVEGNYLKDLHILGRDMTRVAIVDNSVQAFGFQLDNGIPIESWFDDENDNELLNMIPFLRSLKDSTDVRPLIRQTFRLSEFVAGL